MKILIAALTGAALLVSPMAASAHGFGGGHGGFGAGFGGRPAASVPAFRGAQARADLGGRGQGFAGQGFGGRGFGRPAFAGGGFRGSVYRGAGYRWAVGAILPALYWDAYLEDPFAYGLEAAPVGCHWVEADGQALLIDDATGAVVQAAPL